MQIRNSLLIGILASAISGSAIAQNAGGNGEGKVMRTFSENTSAFQVAIIQPDTSDLIFRVFVKNPSSKRIDMNVLEKKNVINTQTISTDYGCSYNLNGLDDGNYSIVITDGKEKVTKEISIKTVFNVNRIISFVSNKREKSGSL